MDEKIPDPETDAKLSEAMAAAEAAVDESLNQFGQMAAMAHELFGELMQRGFEKNEALYLTASVICSGPKAP